VYFPDSAQFLSFLLTGPRRRSRSPKVFSFGREGFEETVTASSPPNESCLQIFRQSPLTRSVLMCAIFVVTSETRASFS